MPDPQPEAFEAFLKAFPVPRETRELFQAYAALLRERNDQINLIAASTMPDLWLRHFHDSAQLFPLLPSPEVTLLDLGSGAGFPGLVLALLGVRDVRLVESIGKKARFLQEVKEKLGLDTVTVYPERLETLKGIKADVLTARAVKALPQLLAWAAPHLKKGGICLFPKGQKAEAELTEARKRWTFGLEKFPSQSDPSGVILRLSALSYRSVHERRKSHR